MSEQATHYSISTSTWLEPVIGACLTWPGACACRNQEQAASPSAHGGAHQQKQGGHAHGQPHPAAAPSAGAAPAQPGRLLFHDMAFLMSGFRDEAKAELVKVIREHGGTYLREIPEPFVWPPPPLFTSSMAMLAASASQRKAPSRRCMACTGSLHGPTWQLCMTAIVAARRMAAWSLQSPKWLCWQKQGECRSPS